MTPARRSWAVAAIACIGGLGGGAVFPILPIVGMDLGISGAMIGLILASNRIARLAFNPVTGSVLDRFGARWPVAAGLVIEAVGTLLYVAALDSPRPALLFLLGRIVWGLGSSLLLVGSLAAVMTLAEAGQRARLVARVRTAISLGLPAGLVLGGLTAARFSNAAAFGFATALSLIGGCAAWAWLPDAGRRHERAPARDRPRFAAWRALFAIPTLRVIWIANALLFFAVSGVLLASFAVVVQVRDLAVPGLGVQGSAGVLMAVLMAARAGAALASGHYLDRAGARTALLLPATAAVALGFVALGVAASRVGVAAALIVVGLGSGALTIPLLTLLGDVAPPDSYGRALSIYQWSSDIGGALGPVVGLVLGRFFGYAWTYALVALLVLAMAAPLYRLKTGARGAV